MRIDEVPSTRLTDAAPPRTGERGADTNVLRLFGWQTTVLVSGAESGGRLALIECEGARGDALPLHAHHHEDELLYVLEGELTVLLGEKELLAPAGSTFVLPRGVEHSFVAESPEARVLILVSPAGFEGFLSEMGEPERTPPVGEDGYALERLICVAARYGVDITGEPPRIDEAVF